MSSLLTVFLFVSLSLIKLNYKQKPQLLRTMHSCNSFVWRQHYQLFKQCLFLFSHFHIHRGSSSIKRLTYTRNGLPLQLLSSRALKSTPFSISTLAMVAWSPSAAIWRAVLFRTSMSVTLAPASSCYDEKYQIKSWFDQKICLEICKQSLRLGEEK